MTKTQQQIEAHRKGDACALVCNARGQPTAASVWVEQETHEFQFGCVVPDPGPLAGPDLERRRCRLAELFNHFPEVTFPISVLSSGLNQELVSYAWIFPNVVTSGHWWYANIPAYIEHDARARLQAVPKTKQIGYYSDMYKLEFALPKYNMYRRALARVLADDFVRPGRLGEAGAVEMARLLLRDNVRRVFKV